MCQEEEKEAPLNAQGLRSAARGVCNQRDVCGGKTTSLPVGNVRLLVSNRGRGRIFLALAAHLSGKG